MAQYLLLGCTHVDYAEVDRGRHGLDDDAGHPLVELGTWL